MRTNAHDSIGTGWQPGLWHDTVEDALRAAVDALGGPKRVAAQLWPAKSMSDAQRHLLHCLDLDRREKLDLAELDLIGRLARDAGCHVLMAYFARSWDYEMPVPVDAEDEHERLQQAFMESVRQQQNLVKRLEQLERNRRDRELRRVS